MVVITVIEYRRAPEKFQRLSEEKNIFIKYFSKVMSTWNVFAVISLVCLGNDSILILLDHINHLERPV